MLNELHNSNPRWAQAPDWLPLAGSSDSRGPKPNAELAAAFCPQWASSLVRCLFEVATSTRKATLREPAFLPADGGLHGGKWGDFLELSRSLGDSQ